MGLSDDLVTQFSKIVATTQEATKEETVTGEIVEYDGQLMVRLDGSDRLTPCEFTAATYPGERVTVRIKNHTATVTGSLSSPAAGINDLQQTNDTVADVIDQISDFEIVIADKVSTKDFDAEKARIDELKASEVVITGDLTAAKADISELEAANVTITEQLTAANADIENLETTKLDASIADIKYATVENLDVTNGTIHNLESTYGDFARLTAEKLDAVDASITDLDAEKLSADAADLKYATIDNLDATNVNIDNLTTDYGTFKTATAEQFAAGQASIEDLQVNKLSAADIEGKFANIDFSNIGEAAIKQFYATSGIIEDLVIGQGVVTGKLVGITIKGDLIEGGTVIADKLVVKGTDGLYYKLNTDGVTTESEQTEYNSLNGSVITAKSITATKISVEDLVAFDATIGGFNITDSAIYSGVKASVDNTTTGVYMDKTGQLALGDATNFVKYYRDTDGSFKLAISASSISFGASNKNLETEFNTINDTISLAQTAMENMETEINQNAEQIELRATKTELADAIESADIRITEAESSITQNTEAIGLRVTREEAEIAVADTLASAKSYTDSQIEVSAAGITSTVTEAVTQTVAGDIQTAFDNLEIGGRNLALDMSNDWSEWITPDANVDNICHLAGYAYLPDSKAVGDDYTCSIEMEFSEVEAGTGGTFSLRFQGTIDDSWDDSGDNVWYRYIGDPSECSNGVHIIKYTNKITSNTVSVTKFELGFRADFWNGIGKYRYRKIKVEKGNKATDWTPAPEDVDSNIVNAVDAVEVGGRNLLRYTGNGPVIIPNVPNSPDGISNYCSTAGSLEDTGEGFKLTFGSNSNIAYSIPLVYDGAVQNNEEITLSFYYRGNIMSVGDFYFLQRTIPNSVFHLTTKTMLNLSETEWQKCEVTFSVPLANVRICYQVLLFYALPQYDNTRWIEIKKGSLKLEKGNKATDWTPAPEDMAEQENLNALANNLTETKQELQTNIELNMTQIEQLANMISSIVTDANGTSLMTQTADGFTFNIGDVLNQLSTNTNAVGDLETISNSIQGDVNQLQIDTANLKGFSAYVRISTTITGQPCLELGQEGSDFKIQITNTDINFMEGTNTPAYITNADGISSFVIENGIVQDSLKIGGFEWFGHGSGSMGLVWRGV